MFASREGHVALVRALIGAGVELHVADENGQTALSFANCMGHTEVIEALVLAGAQETGEAPPRPDVSSPPRSSNSRRKKGKGKGKKGKKGKKTARDSEGGYEPQQQPALKAVDLI